MPKLGPTASMVQTERGGELVVVGGPLGSWDNARYPDVRHLPPRPDPGGPDRPDASAWSVTSNATVAALTALWGLLASLTSLRVALAIAGLLLLATPLLLPKR